MGTTRIITHRGLDPSLQNFPMESSIEAFRNQLSRGYGLEFDVRRTKDDQLVVVHDKNLKRLSAGLDTRDIHEVSLAEILEMDFNGNHLASLVQVLSTIKDVQQDGAVSAIHLKNTSQDESTLNLFLSDLAEVNLDPSAFIIFDVKVPTAQYLRSKNPALRFAPSVAHSYDIKRYNSVVGGTLLSVEEVLGYRDLFDWVWLDEWDLADEGGAHKKFYTKEMFRTFQEKGIKVALVTPELHGTSPGLIGGEAHEDAQPFAKLAERLKEIISLKPDAVCTDYPDYVKSLV